jgi:hypothetical protein
MSITISDVNYPNGTMFTALWQKINRTVEFRDGKFILDDGSIHDNLKAATRAIGYSSGPLQLWKYKDIYLFQVRHYPDIIPNPQPLEPLQIKTSEHAKKAADAIINNLATSDFITHCGSNAIKELREYRLYIAATIQKIIEQT